MLGFKKNTTPLSPEASQKIRQTAFRIATGNLNETDFQAIERQKQLSTRFTAEWR